MAGKPRPWEEGIGANVWLGLAPDSHGGYPHPPLHHPRPSGRPRASGAGLLETGATTVSLPKETGALAPGLPASAPLTGDGRRFAQLLGSSWISAKSEAARLVPWPPQRGLVLTAIRNQAFAQPQCPHL